MPAGSLDASAGAESPHEQAKKFDDVHRDASHGAQNEIEVSIHRVPINLHHQSLSNIVAMQFWYANVERWQKLAPLRPANSDVTQCARQWWVFAIKAVLQERPRDFLKRVAENMKASREYGELFKRKYATGRPWLAPLGKSEEARVAELEQLLPIELTKRRRHQAWMFLGSEEQGKDHRKRDFEEMETELLSVTAGEWKAEARQRDTILYEGWMLVGRKEKKALKNRWVVLADVNSIHDTRRSGWVLLKQSRNDQKEVWDRMWFRLKGVTLSYFLAMDDVKPRREIPLATVSHISSDSPDSFQIVTSARTFHCKCDRPQDCTAWTDTFSQCFAQTHPRPSYRWMVVYKSNSDDTKPLEAFPLELRTYTLKPPKTPVRDCENSALVLRIGLMDFSVRECVLALSNVGIFMKFSAVIAPDAAEVLNEKPGEGHTTLSATQQALLDEQDLDDEEDEDDEGFDTEAVVDEDSDYLRNRIVVSIGHVSVAMGIEAAVDWVALELAGVSLDISNTASGASGFEAQIHNIAVEDRYTRDTCFPRILRQMDEQAIMLQSEDGQPMFRFRYKMTFSRNDHLGSAGILDAEEDAALLDAASGSETDVFVQLILQPLKIVVNPELVPLFMAFASLQDDDGIKQVQDAAMQNLQAVEEQADLLTGGAKMRRKIKHSFAQLQTEQENVVHRTMQVEIGAVEIMLAEDLSKMRDDAHAVVLRLDCIHLGNADGGKSPRGAPAMAAKQTSRLPFHEFRGELRNLELFCCNRDNVAEGVSPILLPISAPFSMNLAEHPATAQDGWAKVELDVSAIQLSISKQSLTTLVSIGTASAQTIKRRAFSPSTWLFASSGSGERSLSRTALLRQKLSRKKSKASPNTSPTRSSAAASPDSQTSVGDRVAELEAVSSEEAASATPQRVRPVRPPAYNHSPDARGAPVAANEIAVPQPWGSHRWTNSTFFLRCALSTFAALAQHI